MGTAKLVSIVLLNWNGREVLKHCLNSIKEHTRYPNYEIILVDNGSRDGSVEMVRKEFPEVKLIENPENYGIPKASNQGAAIAKGDYIIFQSNDTLVTEGWMKNLIEVIESDEKISTVGATLLSMKQAERFRPEAREIARQSVCSAAMAIRKKIWQEIGPYDEENFSPYGADETDWNYRAINKGYKVLETRRALVKHIGQHDTAKQNPNQYFLLHYHTWKAILANSTLPQFLARLPGQGLVFVNSFKYRKTPVLLKVYFGIIKNLPEIWRMRKNRFRK